MLLVCLLIGPGPVGLQAFQTGALDRASSLETVDDGSGGVTIEPYHGMQSGETCMLADLSNGLGSTLSVTVALRDDATQYGNLTLGSGNEGNEVTFSLAVGATERVEIDLASDVSDGTAVGFDVNASDESVAVSAADRSATVNESRTGTECSST
ncbi:hypothetical protein GCM10027435_01220 [Haloparvum alkalitolerans]